MTNYGIDAPISDRISELTCNSHEDLTIPGLERHKYSLIQYVYKFVTICYIIVYGSRTMTEAISSDKLKHSPTLHTIEMVEHTLENYPNSVVTIPELKKALPKQVNHNTLMTILEYLESSNKIYVGLKGITWIHNRNEKLRNVVRHGFKL